VIHDRVLRSCRKPRSTPLGKLDPVIRLFEGNFVGCLNNLAQKSPISRRLPWSRTPKAGSPGDYPHLEPILSRPIDWELIRKQYDEMVKYATALRLGTAETEAILRRFTKGNLKHPTYLALAELGKVKKTVFLCRYLHSEALRQEVEEALNVVERWNGTNGFIFFGKGGEVATNRLEDQELSVLCLHLLQICLVYINTLMIQNVLADPGWLGRMGAEDFRALTPLIYAHVNPYGRFELDMEARLPLDDPAGLMA
jgi:hypothetical protein